MSIYKHYLQTAAQLICAYNGSIPLHHLLKHFFSQHKKYGSRDRKLISGLCYNYYRLGKAGTSLPVEEKIIIALFICSEKPGALLADFNPVFNENVSSPLQEKLAMVGIPAAEIFPYVKHLSVEINGNDYSLNMLRQPDVFMRIRPGQDGIVQEKLKALEWDYKPENNNAIRLKAGLPVDKNFKLNEEIVIQDLNSQKIGSIVKKVFDQHDFEPNQLWDCCAASGGKSIMMNDFFPGISITVSDIRQTILFNLAKRFKEAGIKRYNSFVADLSLNQKVPVKQTPFIIADVPCTGSGTWSRTPEQLYFFTEDKINEYAEKQFAIASNAVVHLLPGGWFVYITCSVFFKENEEAVQRLLKNTSLQLINQQILDGTNMQADSMFVAILRLKG